MTLNHLRWPWTIYLHFQWWLSMDRQYFEPKKLLHSTPDGETLFLEKILYLTLHNYHSKLVEINDKAGGKNGINMQWPWHSKHFKINDAEKKIGINTCMTSWHMHKLHRISPCKYNLYSSIHKTDDDWLYYINNMISIKRWKLYNECRGDCRWNEHKILILCPKYPDLSSAERMI